MEPRATHETMHAFHIRREKARKLGLVRLMAVNHVQSVGNRRRKATFNAKEIEEAAALGMIVDAYRKHKKGKRLFAKMEKIIADRAAA